MQAVASWHRSAPALMRCRPGVTEAELDTAGETLGVQLPLTLRVLYRFLNGQESHEVRSDECWLRRINTLMPRPRCNCKRCLLTVL
jgi:cell wall assembly regulator SMI1